MIDIHPTALVDPGAELDDGVRIGPWSSVGPKVRLGRDVVLDAHVVVDGKTTLGESCQVFPFTCLGKRPQDLKFQGEETELRIGAGNQIREHVTMHPGTGGGGGITRIGDGGLFMVGVHVAHDCQIGDGVIMANNATLAGHVEVQDYVVFGGLSAAHQFVRIGRHAMVGGLAGVENDVIPYGTVLGNRAYLNGLNIVGMKRRGLSRTEIRHLRTAYRLMFAHEGTFAERLEEVARLYPDEERVREIVSFIRKAAEGRAICLPRTNKGS